MLGRFSGDEAVQGAKAEEVAASFCGRPRGRLTTGKAEYGDVTFRRDPRGRLVAGEAEDGDLAFRGQPRGHLAAGEAVEMSFDVGARPWGRLAGSNSCKAAVRSAASTGKPMPESEPESLFTSMTTIPLAGLVAGAGACAGYISIQGGGGKRGRRGRC